MQRNLIIFQAFFIFPNFFLPSLNSPRNRHIPQVEYHAAMKLLEGSELHTFCEVRWGSVYDMMASVLANKKVLRQASTQLLAKEYTWPCEKFGWYIWADSFWATLTHVTTWLQPLRLLMTQLQGDSITLGHAVEMCLPVFFLDCWKFPILPLQTKKRYILISLVDFSHFSFCPFRL